MGRRIYDESGEFVWKYTFGRQPSEMNRYAEEFSIGEYESSETVDGENTWTDHSWNVTVGSLKLLKNLFKKLMNGHTKDELNKIGMVALKTFVEKQDDEWKKTFEEYLPTVYSTKTKSIEDFSTYGVGKNKKSFNIYDIFAGAVENEIEGTYDFLMMTKVFIDFIEKRNLGDESLAFIDEW